ECGIENADDIAVLEESNVEISIRPESDGGWKVAGEPKLRNKERAGCDLACGRIDGGAPHAGHVEAAGLPFLMVIGCDVNGLISVVSHLAGVAEENAERGSAHAHAVIGGVEDEDTGVDGIRICRVGRHVVTKAPYSVGYVEERTHNDSPAWSVRGRYLTQRETDCSAFGGKYLSLRGCQ